MALLDKLQAHRGGLLQLKTQLYWYGRGGWDNNPGRICLLLDTSAGIAGISAADRRTPRPQTHPQRGDGRRPSPDRRSTSLGLGR